MTMTLSGDGTITGLTAGGLPDGSITQAEIASGVAGKGPAFSAYASASQVITSATYTKLQIQTEEFDTNSNYNTSTYRFTPTVAGYYQVSGGMGWYSPGTQSIEFVTIYKNGGIFKHLNYLNLNTSGVLAGSALIYLNGTTDYVELYGYVSSTNTITVQGNQAQTYFQACLVRAA